MSQVHGRQFTIGDAWALRHLHAEFFDSSSYGITHDAIENLFFWYKSNLDKTRSALQRDQQIRWLIRYYYNIKMTSSDGSYEVQTYIDSLVESRNIPLTGIDEISEPKVFDLHWFSVNGAIQFVKKVHQILSDSPKRLIESEEIVLITGNSARVPWKVTIKSCLLEIYGNSIRVDEMNSGRLILTMRKKLTYSDVIFPNFTPEP